jgi:hypothetical protein
MLEYVIMGNAYLVVCEDELRHFYSTCRRILVIRTDLYAQKQQQMHSSVSLLYGTSSTVVSTLL